MNNEENPAKEQPSAEPMEADDDIFGNQPDWLCYQNKRIISVRSGAHPVYTGPVMLHFTKDEETFGRFCLEMVSANPVA